MLKQNTYLVPTHAIFETIITRGSEAGVSESSINKTRIVQKTHLESFKKAYKAGVRCGLGSDFLSDPLSPMGNNGIELQLYAERAGLSPMETIVCATNNNAEALNVAYLICTLEPGKWADLLVVQGDPFQDISILCEKKNIRRLYKCGIETPRLSSISVGEPEQASEIFLHNQRSEVIYIRSIIIVHNAFFCHSCLWQKGGGITHKLEI